MRIVTKAFRYFPDSSARYSRTMFDVYWLQCFFEFEYRLGHTCPCLFSSCVYVVLRRLGPCNWLIPPLKIVFDIILLHFPTVIESSLGISYLRIKHSNAVCFQKEAVALWGIITLISLFVCEEWLNKRVRKFYSEDLHNLRCLLSSIRWSNEGGWHGSDL
jgi:hypothetical protein